MWMGLGFGRSEWRAGAGAAVLVILGAAPAEAQSTESPASGPSAESVAGWKPVSRSSQAFRPHGAIEAGVGILALPGASHCSDTGCGTGDLGFEVDAWPIYRASPQLAVGAGLTVGFSTTQEDPRDDSRFGRSHSRQYFLAEGLGRYYFLRASVLEAWVGATAGLVVVSDDFQTKSASASSVVLVPVSTNIATEGVSLGIGAGAQFAVGSRLSVGGTARLVQWVLPVRPELGTLGDEATLSGRLTMLHLALSVAYSGR